MNGSKRNFNRKNRARALWRWLALSLCLALLLGSVSVLAEGEGEGGESSEPPAGEGLEIPVEDTQQVSDTPSNDTADTQVDKVTIKWMYPNDDNPIKTQEYDRGADVTYPDDPEHPTEPEKYHFTSWDQTITTADNNYTITAQYAINTYTITWVRDDGTLLDQKTLEYGADPTYNGTPTKDPIAGKRFEFLNWDKGFVPVTETTEYKAFFSEIPTCQVTWKNSDGSELAKSTVDKGTTPSCPDTASSPTKPDGVAGHIYSFTGWSPALGNSW